MKQLILLLALSIVGSGFTSCVVRTHPHQTVVVEKKHPKPHKKPKKPKHPKKKHHHEKKRDWRWD